MSSASPHLDCIPRYEKFIHMGKRWYFGPMEMRLKVSNCKLLAHRLKEQGAGGFGFFLVILGFALFPRDNRGVNFFRVWRAGAGGGLVIFFHLNTRHDYYQIRFLAPFAFFIALSVEWLFLDRPVRPGVLARVPFALTMLLLIVQSVRTAEEVSYKVDWVIKSAGETVREHTPDDALVLVALHKRGSWYCDPRTLYIARRFGWAVPLELLDERCVRGLLDRGAAYLAAASAEPMPPDLVKLLESSPKQEFELKNAKPWRLHLYRLNPKLKDEADEAKPL